ncbi:hypothetical protein [Crystallibacter degradans]|uniref:hypothetical protein n=1 Tax=Crystallibacter degradans TaxID=2726743 RepID=UPI00147300C4|nr:hypothetical protein [Arthrobacter sp. SF27]NMR31797.1 hypothetical protein [Arthrobacter sp. SF27]
MSLRQPHASPHAPDLALLTAGCDTGWWDEHGRPAPWPEDFWLPDGTINPIWRQDTGTCREEDPATATRFDGHPF